MAKLIQFLIFAFFGVSSFGYYLPEERNIKVKKLEERRDNFPEDLMKQIISKFTKEQRALYFKNDKIAQREGDVDPQCSSKPMIDYLTEATAVEKLRRRFYVINLKENPQQSVTYNLCDGMDNHCKKGINVTRGMIDNNIRCCVQQPMEVDQIVLPVPKDKLYINDGNFYYIGTNELYNRTDAITIKIYVPNGKCTCKERPNVGTNSLSENQCTR